jgi:hypothetical protein
MTQDQYEEKVAREGLFINLETCSEEELIHYHRHIQIAIDRENALNKKPTIKQPLLIESWRDRPALF